jgi:hypothetical protein
MQCAVPSAKQMTIYEGNQIALPLVPYIRERIFFGSDIVCDDTTPSIVGFPEGNSIVSILIQEHNARIALIDNIESIEYLLTMENSPFVSFKMLVMFYRVTQLLNETIARFLVVALIINNKALLLLDEEAERTEIQEEWKMIYDRYTIMI